MKNITVAVPDDVYRWARVRASEQGKSLSALVADYLEHLSSHGARFSALEGLQEEVRAGISSFRAADHMGRDDVHARTLR